MAFNTTINFTQNVPISLGLTNYFAPTPARQVTANFLLDTVNVGGLNFATIDIPEVPGVTIATGRAALNSSASATISLVGDAAAVNTALNGCMFRTISYSVEELQQDVMSIDRALGNYKGELLIQIPPESDISSLAVGTAVTFSNMIFPDPATDNLSRYTITKIDSVSSPIRIWMIYNRDYNLADVAAGANYKNVNTNKSVSAPSFLQKLDRTNIGPVIDMAFGNAQGTLQFTFRTVDGATEDNTFIMVGKPQIAEPTFTQLPPASASAPLGNTWYQLPQMGRIAQADNNYVTVQLLIKLLTNDPQYLDVFDYTALPGYPTNGTELQKLQFVGDKIHEKARLSIPKYATSLSYALIGDSQTDRRASVSFPNQQQEVKWSFFGTPAECNVALARIFLWRYIGNTKDFAIETRIIDAKSRIYATRGKL
jgi:hypothetical protein